MTPTQWLLLGLIVLCALCLFVVVIGHCIDTEWRNTDDLVYRTADGNAIKQQTSRIIANANAHASAPHVDCCCDLETARREGTAAALHDMGQKFGSPPTANPYARDALAHVAWRRAYQRTSSDTTQLGAA